jgi:hypothetical protein
MTNEHNDLDNDLVNEQETMELGIEWIAAHLLSIIIFLEDKFGDEAGHMIGAVAADLLTQFTGEQDSE